MTPDQMAQLEAYFTSVLGENWQHRPFVSLDGMEVVEALWPMNDVFRAHHAQIASLAYAAELEGEADQALRVLVEGGSWTANSPSAGVWRVLMERHIQSLTVAIANHVQGNERVMSIPQDLPIRARKFAAMLWLQWAMVLPFPVGNRVSYQWPGTSPPDSLTQH